MKEQTPDKPRRISESSPEYKAHLKIGRCLDIPLGIQTEHIFGKEYLDALSLDERIEKGLVPRIRGFEERRKRRLNELPQKTRRAFEELLRSKGHASVVAKEIQEFLQARAKMGDTVAKKLAGSEIGPSVVALFISSADEGVFLDFLRWHQEQFKKKSEELDRQAPQLKKTFLKKIRESKLNSSLKEKIASRLRSVRLIAVDAYSAELEKIYGAHNWSTGSIAMAVQLPPQHRESTYAHEAFHSVAGKSIMTGEGGSVFTQRKGFYFLDGERFDWLDEAFTEDLTLRLFGGEGVYQDERRILELLQSRGKTPIPLEFFMEAYFEDLDPSLPAGGRIPAWKRLRDVINSAFGPGFLLSLDKVIKNEGIKRTISLFEEDWHLILGSKKNGTK